MASLLSIHFPNSYFEYPLPAEDNRELAVPVSEDMCGIRGGIILTLDIREGRWFIADGVSVSVYGGRAELYDGMRIQCKARANGKDFTIVVQSIPEGYARFDKYRVLYGAITIGAHESCAICFNVQSLVSQQHAVLDMSQSGCTIADKSRNGTFVNGKKIQGMYKLNFGDTISIFGLKIVYFGDILAINRPTPDCRIRGLEAHSVPPAAAGYSEFNAVAEYYHRSPRSLLTPDDETLEIEAPPGLNQNRYQPLLLMIGPALTMTVPMLVSALAMGGNLMGLIMSVSAAALGVMWALISLRYTKKMEREETHTREVIYGSYLEKMRGIIEKKHSENRKILDKMYPELAASVTALVEKKSHRLWERNVNHRDFLTVRLGLGSVPSPNAVTVPKERFTLISDELADEPRKIRDEFLRLTGAPVCVPLAEKRLIGITGDSSAETARTMALSLAMYHTYADVKLALIYDSTEAVELGFARWLPHTWDGDVRLVADNPADAAEVLRHIASAIKKRLDENEKPKGRITPHYIIFVTKPELLEGEVICDFLYDTNADYGVSSVLCYGEIGLLPNSCSVVIRRDSWMNGYCSLDGAFEDFTDVKFDTVTKEAALDFARSLSGTHIREELAGSLPRAISFLEMYRVSSVDDGNFDVYKNWLHNRSFESMKAMVGYKNADTPLYLDIHQSYHGSHGLVAGTTGSGKSETLQTYILSLAASFSPNEVSFLLIDFKGGGMANAFQGLPHLAGIITNDTQDGQVSQRLLDRALNSITTEVKRRLGIIAPLVEQYGSFDIYKYTKYYRNGELTEALPHLVIIVDEFAELKDEQPEFMKALISASRVGRSLGVHLILATQSPGNSVDEEIWNNSNFRLCLRVQNKQASQAMLKRPDAAYITVPGRGYLQVGEDEIYELFQSGYSGASYEPDLSYKAKQQRDSVKLLGLTGKSVAELPRGEQKSNSSPQLKTVVEHITRVAVKHGVPAVRKIWTQPLAQYVALTQIERVKPSRGSLAVTLGLADEQVKQRQIPFVPDIIGLGKHILVTGPGGAGKTMLVRTLLYGLATGYSPKQVNFYIADFNSKTLGVFRDLPHCGDVFNDTETDKADKFFTVLTRELDRRKALFSSRNVGNYRELSTAYDDVPAWLFVIDGFSPFAQSFPKQEDLFLRLVQQSASYGLYFVITCANISEVPSRVRKYVEYGVALKIDDKYAAEEIIGTRPQLIPDASVNGRGLADVTGHGVLEVQVAVPYDNITDMNGNINTMLLNERMSAEFAELLSGYSGPRATPIPQVPGDMSVDNILCMWDVSQACAGGRYMPIGYDIDEAMPIYADLAELFCFSVTGGGKAGKTTYLKALMTMADRVGFSGYVFDKTGGELRKKAEELNMPYMTEPDTLFDFIRDTLLPEFGARYTGKTEYIESGRENPEAYVKSQQKLCLFIGDMTAFCTAVYDSKRDMKTFLETKFLPNGAERMIYVFAGISNDDASGDMWYKPVMRLFTGYKTGVHLGGDIDRQKVFNLDDVPYNERGAKLPIGQGYMNDNGALKRIRVVTT